MMKKIHLLPLLFLFSHYVMAWGVTGHRVVGEIAESHLSERAKAKVTEILGDMTLAEVSTWMDDIKSDHNYDSLRVWHYTTIPDGKRYSEVTPNREGDVVQGINNMIAGLKSGTLAKDIEREYLMILVHLVGDVHQPLHVGNGKDRGGNDVSVNWFWKSSNLHRVWDSGMIDRKQYSYTELTNLVNHPRANEVKEWQATSAEDWANECLVFRDGIYDLPTDKKISFDYMYIHWETAKQQLLKGGVRLAGVLNDIYG